MRYWAAGLLLTVLLFGGGWLSSGAAPDVSRSVPGAGPGQTLSLFHISAPPRQAEN